MEIKSIEELHKVSVGEILKADSVSKLKFPDNRSKKVSKWVHLTKNYLFETGDIYIIPEDITEIRSFRSYIRRRFNLGISIHKYEGKAYCKMLEPSLSKEGKKTAKTQGRSLSRKNKRKHPYLDRMEVDLLGEVIEEASENLEEKAAVPEYPNPLHIQPNAEALENAQRGKK